MKTKSYLIGLMLILALFVILTACSEKNVSNTDSIETTQKPSVPVITTLPPETTTPQSTKIELVMKEYPLQSESFACAVAKGNDTIKNAANELIAELTANGELDKIVHSYFTGTATFVYTNPINTVPTGKDRENYLVVATNAFFSPFEYYKGNKLLGIDMEIAALLAEKLGKTLYINDMAFDTILPSVMNGESDIGIAGMTVNEYRLNLVDFTDVYYVSEQVLIVREDDTVFADCKSAEEIKTVLMQQNKSFIVGTQEDTTGFMYTAGNDEYGYDGFKNLETKSYTTGALALLDLAEDKIGAVIIDKQPAAAIIESMK